MWVVIVKGPLNYLYIDLISFLVKALTIWSPTQVCSETHKRPARLQQAVCPDDVLAHIPEIVSPTSSLMTQLVHWVLMDSEVSYRNHVCSKAQVFVCSKDVISNEYEEVSLGPCV